MTDLRSLPRVLADRGDIVTPPVAAVARRARLLRVRRTGRTVLVVVALVLLTPTVVHWITDGDESSYVRLVDRTLGETEQATPGPPAPVSAVGPATVEAGATTTSPTTSPPPPECRAGANGGATDIGVSADAISMGALADGIDEITGAREEATIAIRTVFERVNRQGGVCGRQLDLRVVAASVLRDWPPDDGVFAMVGGAGREALDARIVDGSVDRAGMPIVGASGLTAAQHRSSWVWPVGLSAASLSRISADHAYRTLGARTFAVAYDERQAFGREGAAALRDYVATLPGATLQHVQPLDPIEPDYDDEADDKARVFDAACGDGCDFVLWSFGADIAAKWDRGGTLQTATVLIPQDEPPDCRELLRRLLDPCPPIRFWTGFTPPIGALKDDPDVARFAAEWWSVDPSTEGAYLAAEVLVEALRRVGPELTRRRLQEALDNTSFSSGLLGGALQWPTGNVWARAVEIGRTGKSWSVRADSDWVRDPMPGRFPDSFS